MKRVEVVKMLLGKRFGKVPKNNNGSAITPSNIALCKYWGKRDRVLNLPVTSSLSISLGEKGTETTVSLHKGEFDKIHLNGKPVPYESPFAVRVVRFLDLIRPNPKDSFFVDTKCNLPIGAGLASSACGFAALTLALDRLFGWEMSKTDLSILARMGSGSASRSLWHGFVRWNKGEQEDGMDSFAEKLPFKWSDFCVGLIILSTEEKKIGSRKAMQLTVDSSPFYKCWPNKVSQDLKAIEKALEKQDFNLLGQTAESNALAMHATMSTSWPPICYALPETINMMHHIWQLREEGLNVYFTQDAGPSLKLLFQKSDLKDVKKHFSDIEIVEPFLGHL